MGQSISFLSEQEYFHFPPVTEATEEGIVAVGGNLSPGMLISAYTQGIFPWFSEYDPILWWGPDPRFVLFPEKLHIPKSLRKTLRKELFSFTIDEEFERVIENCSSMERPHQNGTWITEEMREAYCRLHHIGYAHSVETWDRTELCGGLYGVSFGRFFFGESMFAKKSDASKAAFVLFVWALMEKGFHLIESQVYTEHIARFGGENIPRADYLKLLEKGLTYTTIRGNWGQYFPQFPYTKRYKDFLNVKLKD